MLIKITELNNEEILTVNSREVAEDFGKEHKHVIRDIEKLILEVGPKLDLPYFTKTNYIDCCNREQTEFLLTRDGFSLLVMGFTGEKALKWKLKYIKAFNAMEKELKRLYEERKKWEIERAKGVLIRHILTDTIKMKITESPNKKFAYPNYTRLIYKAIFGKPFKDLQNEFNIKPKESLRDYLTGEQLRELEHLEMLVSSLIGLGMSYEEIKEFVNQKYNAQMLIA
ncbi:MAG: hypothetical protein RUMPE_01346 [Eubacteriales bacterium SKADARSKE-1]|nr:hypothetical protein [Eubacteriales bacterium SKADARSKE-1]MDQ5984299.1 hypothetical protein [Eubacteriales bacterium SKADARSKE-1]